MSQSNQEAIRALAQYLDHLKDLKILQDSAEWKAYSQFVVEYALNNQDFGIVALWPYIRGENPEITATNNEHFRFYREGLLRSLTLVDEEIAKTEAELALLKTNP